MLTFTATLEIIGSNPFVWVPNDILEALFKQAGKDKGPIQIRGLLNGKPYTQTLVKFQGHWRFYINTIMLPHSPKRIGETLSITVEFDATDRSFTQHPKLVLALQNNPEAKKVFDSLAPSRRNEVVRYISRLKSETTVELNVAKAIDFLNGKGRFVGRDKP